MALEQHLPLPVGKMEPIGYLVTRHSVCLHGSGKSYENWLNCIPERYRTHVLNIPGNDIPPVATDPHCLGLLKNYRSLIFMAKEARKPFFFLKPADGALGSHMLLAKDAYKDFQNLAKEIAKRTGVVIS